MLFPAPSIFPWPRFKYIKLTKLGFMVLVVLALNCMLDMGSKLLYSLCTSSDWHSSGAEGSMKKNRLKHNC